MNFYVYEHWRPDLNLPFYVGKGKKNRAYTFHNRNGSHYKVVNFLKRKGLFVDVRIVRTNLLEQQAYDAEVELVAYWRSQNIKLANRTTGGGGSCAVHYTKEVRRRISEAQKETLRRKGPAFVRKLQQLSALVPRSFEARARMSAAQKKVKLSKEVRERINEAVRKSRTGYIHSEESRNRMRIAQTGRKHSEKTKLKMSKTAKARKQHKNFQKSLGHKHSEETKQKLSLIAFERARRKRSSKLLTE